jgi:hypothetical protein
MPALDDKSYAEFNRILQELEPEVDNMKETPQSFVRDMLEKNKLYGERVFVSPKQFEWLKKLHEEYVGDTDHHEDPRSDEDMDDDIPF